MRKMGALFAALVLPHFASAAMLNYFGFSGIVKRFDQENVIVSVQGKSFKVSKSQIVTGSIKSGDAVYFQLTGEQLQKYFGRSPAAAEK